MEEESLYTVVIWNNDMTVKKEGPLKKSDIIFWD